MTPVREIVSLVYCRQDAVCARDEKQASTCSAFIHEKAALAREKFTFLGGGGRGENKGPSI